MTTTEHEGAVSTMDPNTAIWRKSTRSGNNGGQCVEVAVVHGSD